MPRQARLDAPGTLHHVMLRGIERRAIVTDDADRHDFVRRLGALAMQSRTAIYGWALLTKQAYREFVAAGVAQERRPELVGGGQVRSGGGWSVVRGRGRQKAGDGRILGGEVFVDTVLREAEERIRRQLAVRRNQSGIGEAIEQVCRQAGVSTRELQAGSRRRTVSKIRALLAQRLVSDFGLSLAEVARQLGVSLSAIAKSLQNRQTE